MIHIGVHVTVTEDRKAFIAEGCKCLINLVPHGRAWKWLFVD